MGVKKKYGDRSCPHCFRRWADDGHHSRECENEINEFKHCPPAAAQPQQPAEHGFENPFFHQQGQHHAHVDVHDDLPADVPVDEPVAAPFQQASPARHEQDAQPAGNRRPAPTPQRAGPRKKRRSIFGAVGAMVSVLNDYFNGDDTDTD